MKNIIYVFLFLLIFVAPLAAQTSFKIGPSIAYVHEYIGEAPVRFYGGEIGIKIQGRKNRSINFTALVNTGKSTPRFFRPNTKQKELYTGISQEVQWHFNELYDGGYFGVLFQFMLVLKDSPFGFSSSNPGLDIVRRQFDLGFSTGFIKKINNRYYLNPHASWGINPSGGEEGYQMIGRVGISFGLIHQKKGK